MKNCEELFLMLSPFWVGLDVVRSTGNFSCNNYVDKTTREPGQAVDRRPGQIPERHYYVTVEVSAKQAKAAATRYVVNEPISSSDCHRTMTRSREPCMCRHTLLVTRTGANE